MPATAPFIPASEMLWWATRTSGVSRPRSPRYVVNLGRLGRLGELQGGRIPTTRFSSIVFPEPRPDLQHVVGARSRDLQSQRRRRVTKQFKETAVRRLQPRQTVAEVAPGGSESQRTMNTVDCWDFYLPPAF